MEGFCGDDPHSHLRWLHPPEAVDPSVDAMLNFSSSVTSRKGRRTWSSHMVRAATKLRIVADSSARSTGFTT